MSRHQQRPASKMMTCENCRRDNCEKCVDRLLLLGGRSRICMCTRARHEPRMLGEPTEQQILDPMTGSVHGPGVEVTIDGEVKYRGNPDT